MQENDDSKFEGANPAADDRRGRIALKGFQLMVLLGVFAVGLLLTGVIAMAVQPLKGAGERTSMLILSVMQCVLAFCLPAWAAGRLTTKDSFRWLHMRRLPTWKSLLGVVIVYLLALPAMNQLISWNESIHFPENLAWLEDTLRMSEDAARAASGRMLSSMGFGAMLAAVAVVGVLTGIAEEMFFRGGLQNILTMPGKNAFAVWTAAIVFSAVHFQFFGFVPRVVMGVFFGYLLVWTGSLWVPVFAHALNNSIVVVACYIAGGDGTLPEIDSIGISQNEEFPWNALTSAVATALVLWKFRNRFFKREGQGY